LVATAGFCSPATEGTSIATIGLCRVTTKRTAVAGIRALCIAAAKDIATIAGVRFAEDVAFFFAAAIASGRLAEDVHFRFAGVWPGFARVRFVGFTKKVGGNALTTVTRLVGHGGPAFAYRRRQRAVAGVRPGTHFAGSWLSTTFAEPCGVAFLALLEDGDPSFGAMALEFHPVGALYAGQGAAYEIGQTGSAHLQLSADFEIVRRVGFSSESHVRQSAEVEDTRVTAPAVDRGG
jgi:hypothetical protein